MKKEWEEWGRTGYFLAGLIVLGAALLRIWFLPMLELRAPYLTFYPAVMIAAVMGGIRSGIFATVISAVLVSYFLIEPLGSVDIEDRGDQLSMVIFVLNGCLISVVAEGMHRAKERARQAEQLMKEKIQDEQEIQQITERLHLATQASRVGIWDMDIEKRELIWDARMYEIYGVEQGRPIEMLLWETFIHPEDQGVFRADMMAALAGRESHELELRIICRDGVNAYIRGNKVIKKNFQGYPVRIVGTHTDITVQKVAEKAIRESEARYKAILQQSSDVIGVVDRGTTFFREVNLRWRQVLGYDDKEARGTRLADIVDETPENLTRICESLLEGQYMPPISGRLRPKNSYPVEVEWSLQMVNFAGERFLLFVSHDVSAEQKLKNIISQEVALAADVQRNILPQGFSDLLLSVEPIYEPYHLVSGDFFDYAWSQDNKRFSGFIIDVSGHGVASSLQGIAVSTYFRNVLDSPMRIAAKLSWINRQVMRYFVEDTYAAAIYFEFDFLQMTLNFATAGVYGFLTASAALPKMVKRAGSLIGITDVPEYNEWSVPIRPGELYYFMSDGIFEQITSMEEQWIPTEDYDIMTGWLRSLSKSKEREDDCSALCIKIRGMAAFPFHFEIHRPGEAGRIRSRIRELLRKVAEKQADLLEIALGEALNNGTRESMDIQIKISMFGRRLVMRVKDGGSGFDGNTRVRALKRREPEDMFEEVLLQENGRGIMIMTSWMDRVLYNRQGNEVMLVKLLQDN